MQLKKLYSTDKSKYKYLKIKKIILDKINKKELLSGKPLPSEKELASSFGSSRMTLRQALLELEEEGYLDRIHGKGTFVSNDLAMLEKKLIVLMSCPGIPTPNTALSRISQGIIEESNMNNLQPLFINFSKESSLPRNFKSNRLLVPTPRDEMLPELKNLANKGFNLIVINRIYKTNTSIYCFSTDHHKGMFEAVNFLLGKKHRKIAFLGELKKSHIKLRHIGFKDSMKNASIQENEQILLNLDNNNPNELRSALKQLLHESRPTALVLAEGAMCKHVLAELKESHIKVPDDIEIVTYNKLSNDIPEKKFIHEIIEPYEELSRLATHHAVFMNPNEKAQQINLLSPYLKIKLDSNRT